MRNLKVVTHLLEFRGVSLQQYPVLLWRSGVSRIKNSLMLALSPQVHPVILRFPRMTGLVELVTGPSVVVEGWSEGMELTDLLREGDSAED